MNVIQRLILEVSTAFFLAVFPLGAAFGQTVEASQDAGAASSEVEEELLITSHPVGKRGGRLVAALRAEPKTLNPVTFVDEDSQTVILRLMADLIHINRFSQEVEGALAKSWTVSEDGRRYTLKLRRGVRFSDGHPFDADDVLFTFTVYLDEDVGFPNRDLLVVGGEPIRLNKVDQHTVALELAEPYAAGERIFDSLAILPRHLLAESYDQGKMREVWNLASPAKEVVGLGPYHLKEYVPGRHCVLERNPYYWKMDKIGNRLPYFDELVFLFVANDDAQLIRFQAGDTDVVDRLSAENYVAVQRGSGNRKSLVAARDGFRLLDLGPGLTYNFMFFNLNDLADLPEIRARQAWFRNLDFRRAVSLAIDREGIVKLAFQGLASPLWSHVPPGFKNWVNKEVPREPRSASAARELLSAAGFSWDGDKRLIDRSGEAVEFSIITSSSNSQRMKMATIIQDDLKQLGMLVRVVPLEHRALVERITRTYDYEACILALSSGESDPDRQLPVLLSSGSLHLWHLGQTRPATPWEAEIDRLMRAQSITMEHDRRKKLFDSVQELMAENLPIIFLASPHVLVGAKLDLGNFNPVVLNHQTLWNVEQLFRSEGQTRAEQ